MGDGKGADPRAAGRRRRRGGRSSISLEGSRSSGNLTGTGNVKACPSLGGIAFGSSACPSVMAQTCASAILDLPSADTPACFNGDPSWKRILMTFIGMSPRFATLTRMARSCHDHHFTLSSMDTLTLGSLARSRRRCSRSARSSARRSTCIFHARPPAPMRTVETAPTAAQLTLMSEVCAQLSRSGSHTKRLLRRAKASNPEIRPLTRSMNPLSIRRNGGKNGRRGRRRQSGSSFGRQEGP